MCTTPVSGGMGMHLLQKMGWQPGEGLGKASNGSLQPLLLEVKLDKKGLVAPEENIHAGRRQKRSAQLHQQLQLQQQQQNNRAQLQQHQQQHQQHQQQQQQLMPPPAAPGALLPVSSALGAATEHKHPVSMLGELAAKRKWTQPQYAPVEEFGQPHQKQFLFLVNINGMNYQPSLMSNTKKEAKAVAARYALQQMGVL